MNWLSLRELLNLPGPDFLTMYLLLMLLALALGLIVRIIGRGGFPDAPAGLRSLHTYEKAYLAGGSTRALVSALAALYRDKFTKVLRGKLERAGASLPREAHPLELSILRAASSPMTLTELGELTWETMKPIERKLDSMGVLLPAGQSLAISLLSAAPSFLLLALGVAKICVGIQRDRPVLFLVVLSGLVFIMGLTFLLKRSHRNRMGDRAMEELLESYSGLNVTARSRPKDMGSGDLALAVALYGPAIMFGAEHQEFRSAVGEPQQTSGHFDTSSCSGSSSSSCGGSSCGGSSCGGGGCGGCGGS